MKRNLTFTLLLLAGCAADSGGRGPTDVANPPPLGPSTAKRTVMTTPTSPGLSFVTEEASPAAPTEAALPRAQTQPLSASAAQKLLARLEPLQSEADDVQGFRLRKSSLPAPKTGETIETPFPPPEAPPGPAAVETRPLEVLRAQPEGEVHTVPRVSVTFNQPMVPLTGVADLDALPRPVTLEPEPPGQWRWLGTQTLVFEPTAGRLPMATKYTVRVQAEATSVTGVKLAEPLSYAFSTPGPKVQASWPQGNQVSLTPLLGLLFDQAIDAKAALPHVKLTGGGGAVALRLATEQEVAADPQAQSWLRSEVNRTRTLLLRAEPPLPTDTAFNLVAQAGLPSAEGPRTSPTPNKQGFRTYAPLKVVEATCGWRDECRPMMPWSIRFNNTLDAERAGLEQVTVTPEIKGLQVDVHGDRLTLRGPTQGRTTYEIRLAPGIADQFGQTLGDSDVLKIKVGNAEPAMMVTGGAMAVLDPVGPRSLAVHVINYERLQVRLWKVEPSDWGAFIDWQRDPKRGKAPGKKVFDGELKTGAPKDSLHEFHLDLSAALEQGLGHVIVEVQPPTGLLDGWLKKNPPVHRVWVQSTQLALDAFIDHQSALVWATRLDNGKPKAGLSVKLTPAGASGQTEADGLVTLSLPTSANYDMACIQATDGADSVFLPESEWRSQGTNWSQHTQQDQLRWFTFDDRSLYRPGESVRVKGWLRTVSGGPSGDVGAAPTGLQTIIYKVFDPRGNELKKGLAKVSPYGGFDLEFALPDDANLGPASVQFETTGKGVIKARHHHGFQIQEFRRPEFEVVMSASEGPHVLGDRPIFTTEARYFAGGGLSGAPVQWSFTATPGHFSPPGHDAFSFGFAAPWWWFGPSNAGPTVYKNHRGTTDVSGAHRLGVPLQGASPPRAFVLRADASVQDVNRQNWSAHTELLVHPSTLYVGLKTARPFVGKGEALVVSHLVADLEGKLVAGRPLSILAERMEYKRVGGEYKEVVAQTLTCEAVSQDSAGTCRFEPEQGGRYVVRATVQDSQQRPSQTEVTVWVSGAEAPPDRSVEEQAVRLVPNHNEYQPGDVAEILVLAPFDNAEGLMTLRREGRLHTERFTIQGASHVLKVPITEGHLPKLHVAVELTGAAPRVDDSGVVQADLPQRPAHATGSIDLPVPPRVRALTVQATPAQASLAPGVQTSVKVQVLDAAGKPAQAEVAVIVVDEAVLALAGYALQDPLTAFYTARSPGVQSHRLRREVILGRSADLTAMAEGGGGAFGALGGEAADMMMQMSAPAPLAKRSRAMAAEAEMADAPPGEPTGPAIAVRKDFSALAHFSAAVLTDARGEATVQVKLPDNLTRYRVMAVAADAGNKFGKGESQVTVRLPLMVRPSPPRFLSFGDAFELPVVLQNQTNSDMQVQVALRATNLGLGASSGYVAEVPANDRVEVRFAATADKPGTARFQVAAAAGDAADAATLSLPVYTPATTEAFATYGTVAEGSVHQKVARPKDAVTAFGGLEVSTASTQLQALTDAFIYLLEYPYGCAEQVSSRVISVAALKDVLQAFEAPGLPPEAELMAAMARDLRKLDQLQNSDGGWGFWKRGQDSWPFVSVHVMHAITRADDAGFEVTDAVKRRGQGYLQRVQRYIPSSYPPPARRAIEAYALYVRALMGDLDGARAEALLSEAGGLQKAPMELIAWLYPVFIDSPQGKKVLPQLRRHLMSRVTEEAGTAHFVTSYEEGAHLLLHSDRRVDGLLLEGLLRDQPEHDLVPKIARGLLAHRTKGRWGNTQENAWVLLALNRYFRTYEKVVPNYVARVWLGDGFAGEHRFKGRTTETHLVKVPMDQVPADALSDLIIQKDGPGRLYYRVGLQYAPKDLSLDPMERGFSVIRAYEGVDDAKDVSQDADGVWHVRAGARVRVNLQMVAPTRRYHVALVDKLPAGFEPLNPALAMTEALPAGAESQARAGPYWWWYRPWYEHENLRDERVEAFSTLVWAGVHTYSYVARATTPGRFVAPPAKAEEMYAPEVFGRSGTATVIVD